MTKNALSFLLFSLGVASLSPTHSLAADSTEITSTPLSQSSSYPLMYTDRQVQVDGLVDDWTGILRYQVKPHNTDAENSGFDFALQSTKDAICLLVEIKNPSPDSAFSGPIRFALDTNYAHTTQRFITPANPKAIYDEGGFWFTVTPPSSDVSAATEKKKKKGGKANQNGIISGLQGGYDEGGGAKRFRSKNLAVEFGRSEAGCTLEVSIPWEDLNMALPSPGQFIGFEIGIPLESTPGKGRKKKKIAMEELSWQAGIQSPDRFGALVSVGPDGLGAGIYAPKKNLPWAPDDHHSDLLPLALDTRIVSVNQNATTTTATLTLTNESGTTITRSSQITLQPQIEIRLPSNFAPGEIPAGSYQGTLTLGDHSRSIAFTLRPDSQFKAEAESIISALQPRMKELRTLMEKGKAMGADVSSPDATLAVAELFSEWIPADLTRESMQELALREAKQLQSLIEPAITEANMILAAPDQFPKGAWPSAGKLKFENGNILDESGRPIFLFGIRGFLEGSRRGPFQIPDEEYELATRLGMNFFLEPTAGMIATVLPEEDIVDTEFLQHRRDLVDLHARHGMAAICLFGAGGLSPWMTKKYPGVNQNLGHSISMDISHPGARDLQKRYLIACAKSLMGAENLTGYMIWGEMGVDQMSGFATEAFRSAMKKQYGTIEQLNTAWSTQYSDFTEVEPYPHPSRFRSPIENPVQYYDWAMWNQSRVTQWLTFCDSVLKENDPAAMTSAMISHSQLVWGAEGRKEGREVDEDGGKGNEVYRSNHFNGIDVEALSTNLDIIEDDQSPQYGKAISDKFAFAWELPGLMRDLQRSIAPNKLVRDSEWHGIQPAGSEHLPQEFINASWWLSHLHGADMSLVWFWNRLPKSDNYGPRTSIAGMEQFRRSIVSQPQALAQWAKTNRVLQNHAPEVVAFQAQRPAVHLLWSEPSAILDVHYLDALRKAWCELGWFGRPVGFLTEQMVLNGAGTDCKLLVVPEAKYVSSGVREALATMAQNGTKIVIIGADSLTFTPHSQAITNPPAIPGETVAAASIQRGQWDHWLAEAKVDTSIRLTGADGLSSEPIEFRWIPYQGRKLGYLVNLGVHSEKITLTHNGKPIPYRSLLSKKTYNEIREVPSMEVDLFEFD